MSRTLARRAAVLLWVLAALALSGCFVKFFVADVYRVDSGSMRPTIFGGRERPEDEDYSERVLVVYDRDPQLARFDLVVMRKEEGSEPLVKRLCGLPREKVAIVGGDLLINDERLPPDAPRPEPVTVFDDRYLDVERFFEFKRDGSVRREGREWIVEGAALSPGTLLFYHPDLRDDYLDRRHRRVTGLRQVNDALLECEFSLDSAQGAGRLRLQLVEEGDTFETILETGGGDGVREGTLRLVRRNPSSIRKSDEFGEGGVRKAPAQREVLLAEIPVRVEPGRWYPLSFANIDNHLSVRGLELGVDLGQSYPENEPWPVPLPAHRRSIGPRAALGAEGGRARFRSIRILRDLFYTEAGTFGVEAPLLLGAAEVFLLGDNSASSTDSRHFGPVQIRGLLGRPVAVVWPGFRRLCGARPGP